MKHLLMTFVLMLLLGSCKKVKENIEEEAALNLLDGTKWKITSYTKGSTDLSADFSPYVFRFNKDLTVDALRNNSTESTGTWQGDIASQTISAYFPSAGHPLLLLNATWTITESTTRSLTANTGGGADLRQLKMEKQE